MTMQLQVICDSCGGQFTTTSVPYAIEMLEADKRNGKRTDLCAPCFSIVDKLLYRSATPEDNFGATSDESIRTAISAMAQRRKEVFEKENKDV